MEQELSEGNSSSEEYGWDGEKPGKHPEGVGQGEAGEATQMAMNKKTKIFCLKVN